MVALKDLISPENLQKIEDKKYPQNSSIPKEPKNTKKDILAKILSKMTDVEKEQLAQKQEKVRKSKEQQENFEKNKKNGGIKTPLFYKAENEKQYDKLINAIHYKIKGVEIKPETTDEKVARLEDEIKEETEELEQMDEKIFQIETKIKNNEEKVTELNNKIKELEERLKIIFHKDEEVIEKNNTKQELKAEEPIIEVAQTTTEDKIIEKVEKTLEPEENKIVEEAMVASIPEAFEPKEVRTNKSLYFKNLLAKSATKLKEKIPQKLNAILDKAKKKVLLGVALFGLFTTTSSMDGSSSYAIPKENPDGSKNTVSIINKEELEARTLQKYLTAFHIENFEQLNQIKKDVGINTYKQFEKVANSIDTSLYSKLTSEGRKTYLYGLNKINYTYYIVDKPTATIYAIDKNGKEISSSPVIIGKAGERANTADMSKPKEGEVTTTPAGRYDIGHEDINEEDLSLYHGMVLSLYNTDALKIHITYPYEYIKRTDALKTKTVADNRISWGCINVPESFWISSVAPYTENGSTIFITPDYQTTTTLDPDSGKIKQTSTNGAKFNYQYKTKI